MARRVGRRHCRCTDRAAQRDRQRCGQPGLACHAACPVVQLLHHPKQPPGCGGCHLSRDGPCARWQMVARTQAGWFARHRDDGAGVSHRAGADLEGNGLGASGVKRLSLRLAMDGAGRLAAVWPPAPHRVVDRRAVAHLAGGMACVHLRARRFEWVVSLSVLECGEDRLSGCAGEHSGGACWVECSGLAVQGAGPLGTCAVGVDAPPAGGWRQRGLIPFAVVIKEKRAGGDLGAFFLEVFNSQPL